MVISMTGMIIMVTIYCASWYAANAISRRLKPIKEAGIYRVRAITAGALLSSGACFIGAVALNGNAGRDTTGQAVAVIVTVIVVGLLGLSTVKRTARVKAAEVAAAKVPGKIPSGYTIKTAPDPQPATFVPSFAEKMHAAKADRIIDEIKAGSW